MIRFGAIVSVVAIAIGLLIAGAVSGELTLVYVSIGLAALALLMLIAGVVIWRDEVFGTTAATQATATRQATEPELVAAAVAAATGAARKPAADQRPGAARLADDERQADVGRNRRHGTEG